MSTCPECYSENNRITPLIKPTHCLLNHTQYICGNCGRAICIEKTKTGLYRWNFPFKTLNIGILYLRTADFICKQACSIYEIKSQNNRIFYKIYKDKKDVINYLALNKDKKCNLLPAFISVPFKEFDKTLMKKLTPKEVGTYLSQMNK